jgi:RNA polymerase sigma-70 factor (ECF subfamily)
MKMSDRELVELVIKGEKEAYKEIMMRYEDKLYSIAYSLTLNEEDTKDIVQESFFKAYTHLSGFKFSSSLQTWLSKITYNTSINYIKKMRKDRSINDYNDLQSEHSNIDEKIMIKRALLKLTTKERAVFLMHNNEGMKHKEIGESLGIKEGTVKSFHFRAIEKLQRYLKELL